MPRRRKVVESPKGPLRAALYSRVSTEDQAKEGFSLAAQAQRLSYYLKMQGLEAAGSYVDDGHSGRDIKRPAYARMMAEMGKWDVLVVIKMDRIHRNSRNFMAMMDLLHQHGKEFVSVSESLDTATAMGRFVMDTIQRIAQLESEQTGERVEVSMRQKATMGGGSLGGRTPYGFRRTVDGALLPIANQAAVVRHIFSAYGGGQRKMDIVRHLEENHRGRRWSIWAVTRILENPAYVGAIGWNGILQHGKHPAIIDRALFDTVQARLAGGRLVAAR